MSGAQAIEVRGSASSPRVKRPGRENFMNPLEDKASELGS